MKILGKCTYFYLRYWSDCMLLPATFLDIKPSPWLSYFWNTYEIFLLLLLWILSITIFFNYFLIGLILKCLCICISHFKLDKSAASCISLTYYTPHWWEHLVFVRPPPTIQTFHYYLDEMHWFEAIFEMFGVAVF